MSCAHKRAHAAAPYRVPYRTPGAVWAHIINIQIITKFNLTRDAPLAGWRVLTGDRGGRGLGVAGNKNKELANNGVVSYF